MQRRLSSLLRISILTTIIAVPTACRGSDGDDSDSDTRPCSRINSSDQLIGSALDEECYLISKSLSVETGELMVAPGTTLYFESDAGLTITGNARLILRGTADESIELRGDRAERGFWRGIRLSSAGPHHLENMRLADAGSRLWDTERAQSRGGIVLADDQVELHVVNAELENHEFSAITSDASLATLQLQGSHFSNNDYPLRLHGDQLHRLDSDNRFSENRHNIVGVHTDTPITRDASWSNLPIPYQFRHPILVTGSIDIDAGATLVFERHAGLDFDGGTLHAMGTAAEPIQFLGVHDTRGHWRGLRLADTPASGNILSHVELRHAGSERWERMWSDSQATILVDTDGYLDINHAVLADGDYHAISYRHSTIEGCQELTFDNHYRRDTFAYDDNNEVCFD